MGARITQVQPVHDLADLTDEALVAEILGRNEAAVGVLTRRYNRRLYRIARGIVRDDAEAEDVVQEAYLRAFTGLTRFRGDSAFGTWIVRIAMNEALGRLRRRRAGTDAQGRSRLAVLPFPSRTTPDPEQTMARDEVRTLIEGSISRLPDAFRTVFIARMVEGLSVDETAAIFGLKAETVKTRVHRARIRLREDLERHLDGVIGEAFPFDGRRCERLTAAVIHELGLSV